jgi:hypothetical protein
LKKAMGNYCVNLGFSNFTPEGDLDASSWMYMQFIAKF